MDRAMKEMQAKFRHIVLYRDGGETRCHVPDPDNIALDMTDEQKEANAELVAQHGAHQEKTEEGAGQGCQGGQGGQGGTSHVPTPNRNMPPEPTETSYLAMSELSKEWDVAPSSVYEARGCAVRCVTVNCACFVPCSAFGCSLGPD